MPTGRLLRLVLAVWLFAFLAGASYAMGPSQQPDARVAQQTASSPATSPATPAR